MLVQTDYSLFSSALTVKKAVSISEKISVICDTNLFAVPTFVYECRAQQKKPVVAIQKQIGAAKYLLIALNNNGYHDLVERESKNNFSKEVFKNKDILPILCDIVENGPIANTKYSLKGNSFNKALLEEHSDIMLNATIVNGYEDKDIYTVGLIKAIGETKGFDESMLKTEFCNNSDFSELESILSDVKDYFNFGNPTPPQFKFREEVSAQYNIETKNDQELFEYLCMNGLELRLKECNIHESEHDKYKKRLAFEMNVIKNMKFPGYMLIVWDFVNYAKKTNIPVGPGRGSAAGSLVAFALKITNINPLKYGLLFERFLNPDRVSFPDIDMDFAQEGRGRIIDYVSKKYGSECVSQVITFGKIGGKSSIRDAARAYRVPLYLADKMAKSIPEKPGMTIEKAIKESEDFWNNWKSEDYAVSKVLNGALNISGMTRNLGVHAAGLIIGTVPIYKKAPLYKIGDAQVVGFDGKYLEDVDLVKFDFLGLKTLDVIDNTMKFIKKERGIDIDFNKIDIEDRATYEFIKKGNNLGIFQIESSGMRGLAKSLQPDKFEEVIAMLALFRPGPMEAGMLDSFIERKHGRQKVDYFFDSMTEALKPILEPTYGLIVYQEQVMQIVQAIAGFSLGEADLVRRAMGKKKVEEMERISKEFAEGAEKKGYKKEEAIKLFELIEKFAGYGFNKSHSAAYAMITFQTAYLKTYYPLEFFTALLNSEIGNTDKISLYISEAKELGIDIIKPDIRVCSSEFKIVNKKIAFGLKSIKGVGNGSENFALALDKFGCDSLVNLLKSTQTDKGSVILTYQKKIERLRRSIITIDKNLEAAQKRVRTLNEKELRKTLTVREVSSRETNELKISDLTTKKSNALNEISAFELKIEELQNSDTSFEKINKRVFESLASAGALECFGFSRKFLIENTTALLNPKLIDKIDFSLSDTEYSRSDIMILEEEKMGIIMSNPFSQDYTKYDIPDDRAIAIILNKTSKRKNNGDEYIMLKLILHNQKILEISDFNKKSDKFEIGSEVEIALTKNGKYTNLVYLRKVDLNNFTKRNVELELTILDKIPEDLSSVDTIKILDFSGNVVAVLS